MAKALEAVGTTLDVGTTTLKYVSLGFPGIDNGDAIDNTTLDNTAYVTKQPQKLLEITDISFTALLDGDDWDNFLTECGTNQSLSLTISGEGTLAFWGFLKDVTPAESGKGEAWTVTGTIVVTCQNASDVETVPTWTTS